jgi:hypothetical protein
LEHKFVSAKVKNSIVRIIISMASLLNTRGALIVDLLFGGQIHYATLRELDAQQPLNIYSECICFHLYAIESVLLGHSYCYLNYHPRLVSFF